MPRSDREFFLGDLEESGRRHHHSMAQVYLPYQQRPEDVVRFVIRSSVAPLLLVGAVRDAIQAVDRDQPLMGLGTMADLLAMRVDPVKTLTME